MNTELFDWVCALFGLIFFEFFILCFAPKEFIDYAIVITDNIIKGSNRISAKQSLMLPLHLAPLPAMFNIASLVSYKNFTLEKRVANLVNIDVVKNKVSDLFKLFDRGF